MCCAEYRAPSRHRPGRKGHRVLEHIARNGPSGFVELRRAARLDAGSVAGRKFHYALGAMVREGLLICRMGLYDATPAGERALALLRRGQEVSGAEAAPPPQPNTSVRVFAKAPA